jgi:pSer/pThr/pTyr-binding forkhead associated (FHA) protein
LNCDFSVPLQDLSREHCLLEVRDNHFYITDLGSKNGVSIDRNPTPAKRRVEVTTESRIVLANLYVLKISSMKVQSKADIRKAPKEVSESVKVNREKDTLSFQLEIPSQTRTVTLPKSGFKKLKAEESPSERKEFLTKNIKLILVFITFAFILAYFLR